MGWGILLEKDETYETTRRSVTCSNALHSAFYPLTLPFTVGPGSISVAVTLGANSTRRCGFHVAIILAALIAMAAVTISILFCYGLADQLARVMGKTGMIAIVRLSSFLDCIGVQIIWNGDQRAALVPSHVEAAVLVGASLTLPCVVGDNSGSIQEISGRRI